MSCRGIAKLTMLFFVEYPQWAEANMIINFNVNIQSR